MAAQDDPLVVPPESVADVWPRVKRHIQAACAITGCDVTAHELRRQCSDPHGLVRLVMLPGGAAVVEARAEDSAIHVLALGGDALPRDWHLWLSAWLVSVARAFGCKRVTLRGRKGWRRKLAPLGYREIALGLLALEVTE